MKSLHPVSRWSVAALRRRAVTLRRTSAQAPSGTAKPWTMPRTPDGKPDLQGAGATPR